MNLKILKVSGGRQLLTAFAGLFIGCLLQAGCASRQTQSKAGYSDNLSERLTFYTVPFR